jgi:endonuclease/exonuclease/phosphatase family metal-dependent hydrolase
MWRRYRWWLLLLILLLASWASSASRAGSRPEGCPAGCSTAGERRAGPLRVMSLNMLHGFPHFEHLSTRMDLIAAEIRRQDADIVCLQEVPWTWQLGSGVEYLATRVGMNYVYVRANGNRRAILFEEGAAILSRYPLDVAAAAELQPRPGLFEHRVVLHATAVTPWGDVDVFVTHLTHGDQQVNRQQAASLATFVETAGRAPAIVAGDLNATEDSSQIQSLTRSWVDAYRVANPDDVGLTCCIDNLTAGPSEELEKRIDYLFVVRRGGRRVEVHRSELVLDRPFESAQGWQWASDHVGLLAEIEIEP